jgi:hypothetical protein
MTVNISKPALNLREKLAELDKPSGIAGEAVLRADTTAEARTAVELSNVADSATGVVVDGTVVADGLTVDSLSLNENEINSNVSTGDVFLGYSKTNDVYIYSGGTTGTGTKSIKVDSSGDISFYDTTGSTAKFHWDAADERLGIGTSSPSTALDVSGAAGTTSFTGTTKLGVVSRGSTAATDYVGYDFIGNSQANPIARIGALTTGMGSYLSFGTSNSYASGITNTAMTIDYTGKVLIGATTSTATKFGVDGSATTAALSRFNSNAAGDLHNACIYISKTDANTTASQAFIAFTQGGSASGEIVANGASQVAFGAWSDRRLKENIEDLPSQLANITSLRPVEFNYKDGSGHQIGFIAQELQEVYPDAVSESSDTGMLKVAGWTKNEAIFVKAMQEQQALIEALTTRIEALEAGGV